MEDAIRQRINEIFSYHDITINKFASGDSALQNRLSRQLSRGSSITSDTICLILSKFPDISAEWLMRGTGSMLISDTESASASATPDNSLLETVIQDYQYIVAEQRNTITHLKKQIQEYENIEKMSKIS